MRSWFLSAQAYFEYAEEERRERNAGDPFVPGLYRCKACDRGQTQAYF